ncbi:MAG: hypothetical protein K6B41_06180 [Butyrivibrio sp.]|nr:hypothetical protein [Butyrivibrio sp.]
MYINKKYPVLSDALFKSAAINLTIIILNASIRFVYRRSVEFQPDMLNQSLNLIHNMLAALRIILVAIVFFQAYKDLNKIRSVIPKNDYSEMAKLQEEVNPSGISHLSSYSISQLIQVWSAILVGARMMQEIGSAMYQSFIAQLTESYSNNPELMTHFVSIYNNTHGFKYIGLLTAILIGVFVTGVFLKDKNLKLAAGCIMGIFALSFMLFQMNTLVIGGKAIGIVWTAVIFHLTETFGLLFFAIYLRKVHSC